MSKPIIHHRTPGYNELFKEVREGLKYLFQTDDEVIVLASSGTGSMEGAVSNFLRKGDKAVVVRGGKFGDRWSEICRSFGVEAIDLEVEWGASVNPRDVAQLMKREGDVRAVLVQASETSTGAYHDVEALAGIVREYPEALLIVDGITAIGVHDIKTREWGLDVVLTGSQKGLMLPPGLAMVSVSEKAWSMAERADLPRYYFDLRKERKSLEKNQNAYTPAVSLIVGLREVLEEMKAEGLEAIFERHRRMVRATRAAVKALGLELYAKDIPSNALTAVCAPPGIDGQEVVKILRGEYGVSVAGGQERARGKVFRLSHMGYAGAFDVIIAVSAVEMGLKQMGYPVKLGAGVGAAEEVLMS
jgi:aspartate aminotransferase-like enzyme